ncbi:ABC transporter ATP-binding protein [Streptomyces sp. CB03238]|uniref:ATP-binding cassette domain-containing protein n=1 Tax=Streptomyces sp. CB03238 TaxID=1907777 RepID=UPI00240A87C7|nr:ABC transporter ATP-binding protein [Streptomyces sp. CB03238]
MGTAGGDLTIRRGETVALVGVNGAGKSTLVTLVCGLYQPTRGTVTWDGTSLDALALASLRRRIGVVFQDFMAYDMSAADNIAVGDLNAFGDLPRLRMAADRAGIDAALAALPHGYETWLSRTHLPKTATEPGGPTTWRRGRPAPADRSSVPDQTGVLLSGGQWQRIAIARALVRDDVDLMILDEPSSGLDPLAEREIHVGLREHRGGRSSLLISHRLNTVRDADRILVLRDGQVIEEGDHETLMKLHGDYAAMFLAQADGYQLRHGQPTGTAEQ